MSSRRILLDAGNTRLKWAVVEGGLWLGQGSAVYSDLDSLRQQLDTGCDCYIASVTSASNEQRIDALLTSFDIVPRRLKSASQFKELVNSLCASAAIGCGSLDGADCRACAHTGADIGGVGWNGHDRGQFVDGRSVLGGLIVPGLDLMRQSLLQGTAHVGEGVGSWQVFPRSTADAVHSGIVAALCGAIQAQHARLAEECGRTPGCILTGGDALMLLPHLTVSVEHVPALVLEGIERVASEDDIA